MRHRRSFLTIATTTAKRSREKNRDHEINSMLRVVCVCVTCLCDTDWVNAVVSMCRCVCRHNIFLIFTFHFMNFSHRKFVETRKKGKTIVSYLSVRYRILFLSRIFFFILDARSFAGSQTATRINMNVWLVTFYAFLLRHEFSSKSFFSLLNSNPFYFILYCFGWESLSKPAVDSE